MNPLRMVGVALALLGIAVVLGVPGPGNAYVCLICILVGTASWGRRQALIRIQARDAIRQLVGAMSLVAAPQLWALSQLFESDHLSQLRTGSFHEWFGVLLLSVGLSSWHISSGTGCWSGTGWTRQRPLPC